jgi:hypothetical protein
MKKAFLLAGVLALAGCQTERPINRYGDYGFTFDSPSPPFADVVIQPTTVPLITATPAPLETVAQTPPPDAPDVGSVFFVEGVPVPRATNAVPQPFVFTRPPTIREPAGGTTATPSAPPQTTAPAQAAQPFVPFVSGDLVVNPTNTVTNILFTNINGVVTNTNVAVNTNINGVVSNLVISATNSNGIPVLLTNTIVTSLSNQQSVLRSNTLSASEPPGTTLRTNFSPGEPPGTALRTNSPTVSEPAGAQIITNSGSVPGTAPTTTPTVIPQTVAPTTPITPTTPQPTTPTTTEPVQSPQTQPQQTQPPSRIQVPTPRPAPPARTPARPSGGTTKP